MYLPSKSIFLRNRLRGEGCYRSSTPYMTPGPCRPSTPGRKTAVAMTGPPEEQQHASRMG